MEVALITALIALEMSVRFYHLRYLPIAYPISNAFFLLSTQAQNELRGLNQTVYRSNFRSADALFQHFAKTSGKSPREIQQLYLPESVWTRIFLRRYYSGLLGVLPFEFVKGGHWKLKANLSLKSISSDSSGRRSSSKIGEHRHGEEPIFLTGGSVAFGFGASSDQETISAHLERKLISVGTKTYRVINLAMPGFTSREEYLSMLDIKQKPSIVISLNGWNEVDQALPVEAGRNAMAESLQRLSNRPTLIQR